MSTTQIEIPIAKIRDFCTRWKITEFALFGSVLRENFQADSDVDVLVEFAPDAEWDYWVGWPEMIDQLEAIFGRKVDLVIKKGLTNPYKRYSILKSCQVVYAA